MDLKRSLPMSALALLFAASGNPASLHSAEAPLSLKTAVDRPLLERSGGESKVVIKIEVEGNRVALAPRSPLNLAVVLDRSGSMTGAKLEQAKQAAAMLVDQLDEDDTFSLVVYESEVEVVVPAARLGNRRGEIKRLIERLQTGGSTALHGGVEEGSRQLREFLSKERINRVILLSDGIANVGPSDNRSIADLGRRIAREGMSVTTIGLGNDYNENLMTALAEASDANYYYVADVETLPEVFQKELGELQSIVAREVIIEIRCPEGVRPLRFLGRPGELKSQSECIAFATVSNGQRRELYLECLVEGSALGKVNEIAQVELRYADPGSKGAVAKSAAPVVVGYSADKEVVARAVNQAVAAEAAIFANAEETEAALALADRGDATGSQRALDSQLDKLRAVQAAAPAAQQETLTREIEGLSRAKDELESGRLSSEQRKALQNNSWMLRNSKR